MDRLISLEQSNLVPIRIEPGLKGVGELTLRNVMYTMPVAFRLQPMNKARYTVKPQSGVISPLATLTVEITYVLPPGVSLPETYPHCEDSFLLHSVVVPGATIKDPSSTFDAVPNDWFTTKKKQVFIDSAIKIMFVGSPILARLVKDGSMDEIREVLEKSNPAWNPADSVDSHGRSLLHIAIAQCRPDIVQLLLEFEPDIELQSRTGSSPLEAAVGSGEALIVELLLARRARTERSETSNWGPIHLAAGNGHMDILRLLLLKGANVDSLTKDGYTISEKAIRVNYLSTVRTTVLDIVTIGISGMFIFFAVRIEVELVQLAQARERGIVRPFISREAEAAKQGEVEYLKKKDCRVLNDCRNATLLGKCFSLREATQLHSQVVRYGLIADAQLGATLLDVYAKTGCLDSTEKVFDEMSNRDIASWNVSIAGLAQGDQPIEAVFI
ncbi:ankyrin repeat and protein kinase domain-containing protein 1-like [Tripterygium wilfordii]|uniref:Ankyrin repeat and protein kinase domain-containing protein 1-like n=1 Tax=Tripterygium wilfordii TaxID=458696 RepID=A0A7J7CM87_TRIWF|nr:ankyrin repeat and protein kinase domain-containing protein 1-like [Tripterygium wilfordii]